MNYLTDANYCQKIYPIIVHEEFKKRKNYVHHEGISVYDHSIQVSYLAYRMALKLSKIMRVDIESVIIGGLLHDFYFNPWQEAKSEKKKLFQQHGFAHAKEAVLNSFQYFSQYMNMKVIDIIIKHMFPLNITLPTYRETWIVTIADKVVSMEVLKYPRQWPKYLGLKRKKD